MARITVEDCLEHMDNRFQLVLVATKRVRQLQAGAEPCVDPENDKNTVIALREIAGGYISSDILSQEPEQAVLEDDEAADTIETEASGEASGPAVAEEGETGQS